MGLFPMSLRYLGSCVDSFDDAGDCLLPELGWRDVSEFAYEEASAQILLGNCQPVLADVPSGLAERTHGHETVWLETEGGIQMLYDADADVHYFFVQDEPTITFRR